MLLVVIHIIRFHKILLYHIFINIIFLLTLYPNLFFMIKKVFTLFVLLTFVVKINGQVNISRIFSPNVKVTSRATDFARDAISLEADLEYIKNVYRRNNKHVSLTVPISEKEQVVLELEKFDVLSNDIILSTSEGDTIKNYKPGIFYRGIVKDRKGFATVSIFKNRIWSIISLEDVGNINVVKYENSDKDYIIYNDHKSNISQSFECYTLDYELPTRHHEVGNKIQTREDNCIKVYIEADYELFQNKGGVSGTIDWITAVFAEVATLYNNEGIKVDISEIKMWSDPDGYDKNDSGVALDSFKAWRPTFNGDLASLYSLGGNNTGGLAWVDALCDNEYNYSYINVEEDYNEVPIYSWTVEAITHEMGHNLGSQHTHACVWNSNNTQIDDCGNKISNYEGNTPEGQDCYDSANEIIPEKGTIMSYCHLLSGVGIDFTLGFGEQPGDLIRSRYNSASCLTACEPAPVSNFEVADTNICKNSVIEFRDLSTRYPNQWLWTFDGGTPETSTEKNPRVSWSAPGTYDVSLTATNIQGTGNTETKMGYIVVNGGGESYCTWNSQNRGYYDLGVDRVRFNTIDNESKENTQNVQNFICLHSTEVYPDSTYQLMINVGNNGGGLEGSNCKVYIDYNGDSTYDESEKVYDKDSLISLHTIDITIPNSGIVYNQLLGMRVYTYYQPTYSACDASDYGEAEDYGVIIKEGDVPVSDFTAQLIDNNPNGLVNNSLVLVDPETKTYQFTDLSTNNPNAWAWTFEEGNPPTSTDQNPIVTWNKVGEFNVSLTASNILGVGNKKEKENYIVIKLPIELRKFFGVQIRDFIELAWETETELNNDYFSLYHSTSDENFEFLANIRSSENSIDSKTYNYLHKEPKSGINYYKLMQTDLDGTETELKTISVDFIKGGNIFSVVPNPISFDILSIDCISDEIKDIDIQIVDIKGRDVFNKKMKLTRGKQKIKIPMGKVNSGVYFLRISQEKKVDYLQFVKL